MNTAFAASAQGVTEETTSEIVKLVEIVVTRIPLWIAAFIVLVLTIITAKIARRVVMNKLAERGIEEEHKELQIVSGRMTYSGVLVIGITVALKIAGIDLTTIIAAGAFGIGFALKDMIMNFLAGIMILVGKHFVIGDFISIGSTIGKVEEIQSRVTILKAIDGTKVIVPNAQLFKKQIISFTSNPFRRIEIVVGVDYRHNLENVLKICLDTTINTEGILLEPKPAVLVSDFGESGISIKIKAWVDSRSGWVKIKSELAKNIKSEFDKYGIRIPWPIRTIANDNEMKLSEKMFQEAQVAKQETPKQETPIQAPKLQPQEQEVDDPDSGRGLRPLGEQ
ncbi:MAG: mechanosensitive ion channel family protein [Candidatus Peregrinibacteria bacterium]